MNCRNFNKVEDKKELYLGIAISSSRYNYEELHKDKWQKKYQVYCTLRISSTKLFNLGECNDGGKFTSVNQSINQAKEFINICNKYGWLNDKKR